VKTVMLTIAVCAALVVGCGGSESTASSSDALKSAAAAARPKPTKLPQGPKAHELIVKDPIKGTGAVVKTGDKVSVHYVAGVYERGEEIESAWHIGDPYGFQLGARTALPYWEKGIPGMRVGGRRVLIFPTTRKHAPIGTELGDTLVYVIDMIEIRK
jgi:peptidylprolyl isomerase